MRSSYQDKKHAEFLSTWRDYGTRSGPMDRPSVKARRTEVRLSGTTPGRSLVSNRLDDSERRCGRLRYPSSIGDVFRWRRSCGHRRLHHLGQPPHDPGQYARFGGQRRRPGSPPSTKLSPPPVSRLTLARPPRERCVPKSKTPAAASAARRSQSARGVSAQILGAAALEQGIRPSSPHPLPQIPVSIQPPIYGRGGWKVSA